MIVIDVVATTTATTEVTRTVSVLARAMRKEAKVSIRRDPITIETQPMATTDTTVTRKPTRRLTVMVSYVAMRAVFGVTAGTIAETIVGTIASGATVDGFRFAGNF